MKKLLNFISSSFTFFAIGLIFVLSYTLILSAVSHEYEYIPNDVYYNMRKSTVSLNMVTGGQHGICSGTLIKNDIDSAEVITAKHCVGKMDEIYVDNVLSLYHIISANDDLALIMINDHIVGKESARMADEDSKLSEFVYHMGYPKRELYTSSGRVSLVTMDWHYFHGTSIPGCSGGGIWNEEGELTGVLWGGLGKNLVIYEPIKDVKKFLKMIEKR